MIKEPLVVIAVGLFLLTITLTISYYVNQEMQPKAFCEEGVLWTQVGSSKIYKRTDDGCRNVQDE